MIPIKKKLVPIVLFSIFLLLSGSLSLVSGTLDLDGNGLENGDLDRDRDRDRDGDCDRDEEGNDGTPREGKRNCYGPSEEQELKMGMFHWSLQWQKQYRWNPTPE